MSEQTPEQTQGLVGGSDGQTEVDPNEPGNVEAPELGTPGEAEPEPETQTEPEPLEEETPTPDDEPEEVNQDLSDEQADPNAVDETTVGDLQG